MEWSDAQHLEREGEVLEERGEPACDQDVLVVDDDPEVLVVVSLALEYFGYSVTPVLSGCTALEKMREKRFDLVVTDLIMPEIDGIELLKRTKLLYPATRVILMTGFYDAELVPESIQNQADDFLLKPFSLKMLQDKVAHCLTNYENN